MRARILLRCTVVIMAALMALTPVKVSAAALLKMGSRGSEVQQAQETLKELGYFTYSNATGYYGSMTKAAVKRFQKDHGITADGIIGNKTRVILFGERQPKTVSGAALIAVSVDTRVEYSGALDWFSKVQYIWDRGENAIVTDVETGKSFEVKRTYGTNHADVEPLTKKDTAVIKKIWGGFSWERRAVVVQIGQYAIAASMTAMPHAGLDSASADRYVSSRSDGYGWGVNLDKVKNNGASGVMDIHFKNSRTHTTNTVQKSQQDMVNKAAYYIVSKNSQT